MILNIKYTNRVTYITYENRRIASRGEKKIGLDLGRMGMRRCDE